MGFEGYMVHNNFVYKSTSPNILTYTILLLVFSYVFYQKLWPYLRTMMACGLRVAVNIFKSFVYGHPCLLQVYLLHTGRVGQSVAHIDRFIARYRGLSSHTRTVRVRQVQQWKPPSTSPLIKHSP